MLPLLRIKNMNKIDANVGLVSLLQACILAKKK